LGQKTVIYQENLLGAFTARNRMGQEMQAEL